MSTNLCLHFELKKDGRYIPLVLKRVRPDGSLKTVDYWPWNATHDVFELLEGDAPHRNGLPVDVSNYIKEKCLQYSYSFPTYYTSLADLKYYIAKHPEVPDFDSTQEDAMQPNPLNEIVHLAEMLKDFYDVERWRALPSEIRIVYWFT